MNGSGVLVLALLLGATATAQAQIQVGTTGSPLDTFANKPPIQNWATVSFPGTSATWNNDGTAVATMDANINTFAASNVTFALSNSTAAVPGTSSNGWWSSGGAQFIQTRPTGNAGTILLATLTNVSGAAIINFDVRYDLTTNNIAPPSEEVPGHRVYYSRTGAAGSWVALGTFGNPVAQTIPVSLASTPWSLNTALYLAFVDDNAVTGNDGSYQIDNFVITNVVQDVNATCVGITNQSSSATVPERGSALFSITATGTPQTIQWYRSGNGGATWAAISGANGPSYSIPSVAYPADNAARFYARVSNVLCNVTSTVKILTVVQDTVAPTVVSAFSGPAATSVTLNFSEPMDPFSIDAPNFIVYPTGTDPAASPLQVTFALLNNYGTNVVLTTRQPLIEGTNYSVQMLDLRDDSSGYNVMDPNPTQVPLIAHLELIGFFSEWKYDINNGDRTGTGWEAVAYDDSAWPSDLAPLGLDTSAGQGTGPGLPQLFINTPLAYSANGVVTYFRTHFYLPAGTNGLVLTLRDLVEDGGVYYLNGVEVLRNRMPAGAVIFTTLANGAPDPTPLTGPFTLSLSNVVPGDNVLAVSVHQSSLISSDIEFAAELVATIPVYPSGPPTITTQPQPITVNEGGSATFSVGVSGVVPLHFQWRKNNLNIGGANAPSYTISPVVPSDGGNYSVQVTNSVGLSNSVQALLTVIPDLTSPAFLSAVADTNLTNITLTFGERLNLSNAETPGNYDVHLTAGGGNLTILSATLTNGTNVILVTSPRTQSQGYTIVLSGIIDTAVNENEATPSTRPVTCEIVVLAPDASTPWRYNSASNNLDATGWQLTGYNDAAWPTALAGFTTSNSLEITPAGYELRSTNMLSPNVGGPITAYYRVPFAFPAGSLAGATLHISGVVDDGLVAYVNGVEAGRARVTNASPVSFTNLASAGSPETTESHPAELIVLTNLVGLHTGAGNLLAIELHQNATTSSDAVLSVQLVAGIQVFGVQPPALRISRNPLTGAVTISWSGAGTINSTTNLLNAGTGWTPVPGNPNPYTFTPVAGQPVKFFVLKP